jgi:hypothetical protein
MSTQLENAYMQDYANSFFPPDIANSDLPELVQMRPGAMDAEMTAIPQTPIQAIMEKTGFTLEQIGEAFDQLGKINIGGFEIGLRDLVPFVGSAEDVTDPATGEVIRVQSGTPKGLQMMGQGVSVTTGTGMGRNVRPDIGAAMVEGAAAVAAPVVRAARKAMKANKKEDK